MKPNRTGRMGIRVFASATILAGMLLLAAGPGAMAAGEEDAQGIVDKARVTLGELTRDDNYKWMKEHLKDAKGVLIYPQVLKAGFIFGVRAEPVSSCRGMAKRGLEQPRFLHDGLGELRPADRGESAEVVLLVMTQKAMDSLLTSKFKLGGTPPSLSGRWAAGRSRTSPPISFRLPSRKGSTRG